MIKSTSFIDLLFILLCGTIVMLTQSFQLEGVDAAPAKVGGGAVSPIHADNVRIIGVSDANLAMKNQTYDTAAQVLADVDETAVLVIVPADGYVSHHRVMEVWSQFSKLGRNPQIGVQRELAPAPNPLARAD